MTGLLMIVLFILMIYIWIELISGRNLCVDYFESSGLFRLKSKSVTMKSSDNDEIQICV